MKFPVESFIKGISQRKVYYFASTRISSIEPHYYICIERTPGDILILSCCTSQFNTVSKFVEKRKLPYETLVHISPKGHENPFKMDTYVNCNEYHEYTIEDFKKMYLSDAIVFSGEISEIHYEQILIGLHRSPLIEEDTKAILPKPE